MSIENEVKAILKATPSSVSDELLQIGEQIGYDRWRIGDITNHLISEVKKQKLRDEFGDPVSLQAVYVAVSIMAKREVAPRTIEYYSMLADFFPKEVRDQYEPLPFSHFNFARQHGDDWKKVLEAAAEHVELYGTIPSEGYLESMFDEPPTEPASGTDQEHAYIPITQPYTGMELQTVSVTTLLKSALSALTSLRSLIDRVPNDRKGRILKLLEELSQELENALIDL